MKFCLCSLRHLCQYRRLGDFLGSLETLVTRKDKINSFIDCAPWRLWNYHSRRQLVAGLRSLVKLYMRCLTAAHTATMPETRRDFFTFCHREIGLNRVSCRLHISIAFTLIYSAQERWDDFINKVTRRIPSNTEGATLTSRRAASRPPRDAFAFRGMKYCSCLRAIIA